MTQAATVNQSELEMDEMDKLIMECLANQTPEEYKVMREKCDRIMSESETRYASGHLAAL
jgi:UDP-N-acetylglucosamine:LPS N-acetylglucosamine transferase